jgi:hypothetical protein
LKSESNQIKIENRRLNDNVFDLMVDIEELEQYGASDIAVFIELSIDFVSNVDIMLKKSGFKIAFFMTFVKSND